MINNKLNINEFKKSNLIRNTIGALAAITFLVQYPSLLHSLQKQLKQANLQ